MLAAFLLLLLLALVVFRQALVEPGTAGGARSSACATTAAAHAAVFTSAGGGGGGGGGRLVCGIAGGGCMSTLCFFLSRFSFFRRFFRRFFSSDLLCFFSRCRFLPLSPPLPPPSSSDGAMLPPAFNPHAAPLRRCSWRDCLCSWPRKGCAVASRCLHRRDCLCSWPRKGCAVASRCACHASRGRLVAACCGMARRAGAMQHTTVLLKYNRT